MSLIDKIIAWYSVHMNYASITALMAVESSFIPFPSEVVIPPAAFVAGQPESVLCATGNYLVDVLIIVLFGTLGAMIGAIINYGLSVWLGRIVIYKFADSASGDFLSAIGLSNADVLSVAWGANAYVNFGYFEAQYHIKGCFEDLKGAFLLGLTTALQNYDAGKDKVFFDYAKHYARNEMHRFVRTCYYRHSIHSDYQYRVLRNVMRRYHDRLLRTAYSGIC